MNDYWNNPPEYDDPPECCDDLMDVEESGDCVCSTCGKRIEAPTDPDPAWEDNTIREIPDPAEKCPHGREWTVMDNGVMRYGGLCATQHDAENDAFIMRQLTSPPTNL